MKVAAIQTGAMSRIPYPTDAELDDDARAILAALPPLNVVRMFAGAPAVMIARRP